MTSREIAAQYAKALFGVAVSDADPRQVGEQIAAFARLSASTPDLRRALTSPAVPVPAKQKVVEQIAALGGAVPLVRQFLLLLARHDHLKVLDEVAAAYEARLLRHLGIIAAEVTSAIPLDEGRQAAIASRLSSVTGKQVRVSVKVDPALLGGVVAKVGSTVYDGSVVRQLQRMKEQIIERA